MSNNQGQLRITAGTTRRAFTLVELLVVGAIIVILVALTLIVMNMVANSTKEAKTRATVQKIDVAMQSVFGAYEREFNLIKDKIRNDPAYSGFSETERQKIAAHFIRDLMRMEMPQSWAEVFDTSLPMVEGVYRKLQIQTQMTRDNGTSISVNIEESPLLDYYYQAYRNYAGYPANVDPVKAHEGPGRAALLFLIIQNLNPEALEAFHGSEVADTDGDGLLEFVDAWGNPIQFLRWAPAFSGSDLQQDVVKMAGGVPNATQSVREQWWRNREMQLPNAMKDASMNHPDPMDERADVEVIGWFLYPLIYSAGPDGKYGIYPAIPNGEDENVVLESPQVNNNSLDPNNGILDPFIFPFGMPYGTEHFDNIHNHQWYRSF